MARVGVIARRRSLRQTATRSSSRVVMASSDSDDDMSGDEIDEEAETARLRELLLRELAANTY